MSGTGRVNSFQMQLALLIFVVSYIAITAHDGNKTVLIEFGRYIQALGVLL